MRPRGSGYKTQAQIRELLYSLRENYGIERLRFGMIAKFLNNDEHKASRNLKVMMEKGLIKKEREGRKTYYSLLRYEMSEKEKKDLIKKLKNAPAWHKTENGKKWLESLPPRYTEYHDEDEKYSEWIKFQEEINPLNSAKLTVEEVIAWAKELRKVKTLKSRRSKGYGAKEPIVGPRTKKPSPFKPKY